MKQIRSAALLCAISSLLSSQIFAHTTYKDEALSVSTTHYNWTGYYFGLNAGIVKHSMDITDSDGVAFNSTIHQASNPQFIGGFQVGYRKQLELDKTSGVFGIEFNSNFSNASADQDYGSPFASYQLHSTSTVEQVCLLQLTGGLAADRTLIFLSAGISWSDIGGKLLDVAAIPFFNSVDTGKKALGTVIGVGLEYALNDKFSLRFKIDDITPTVYSNLDNVGDSFQISNNIVQGTVGINYKFS